MSPIVDEPTNPPTSMVTPGAKPVKYEFFKAIQTYLEDAAKVADVPEYIATILSQPKNEIIVNFPVRMDDGTVRLFKGYRIQHNNLLGPFKGGLRYHQSVSLDDLKALAAMMTWKCALMNLPLGGGQGRDQVRPERGVARRAAADHAALHPRARLEHRPRDGRARAGHGHRRAHDGLGHGHVHDTVGHISKQAVKGRGHRQARAERRDPRSREGDGPGRRALHHRVGRGEELRSRRRDDDRARLRQRRVEHRGDPVEARGCRRSPSAITRATSSTPRASTRTSSRST